MLYIHQWYFYLLHDIKVTLHFPKSRPGSFFIIKKTIDLWYHWGDCHDLKLIKIYFDMDGQIMQWSIINKVGLYMLHYNDITK